MDTIWNFFNGMSNNLQELLHPFKQKDALTGNAFVLNRTNLDPLRRLIEIRRMMGRRKLVYDWRYLLRTDNSELLRVFGSLSGTGFIMKNLRGKFM